MSALEKRVLAARAKTDMLIGALALEIDRETRARRAAMAAVMDEWLGELPEDKRAEIFAGLEAKANSKNRKLIQRHPARPEMVAQESASSTPPAPAVPADA